MTEIDRGEPESLSLEALIDIVGREAFEAACVSATSTKDVTLDVPHSVADRLWYEGNEPLLARLKVAAAPYRVMPNYGNLMYWRHPTFDEPSLQCLWALYREFLDDPRSAIAEPAMYSLWVDWFEDHLTVQRAWSEVAGPQQPRRPRLERVLSVSGPIPWALKAALYERLAREGDWDDPIVEGLYGSCIDVYGSLDRLAGLRILRRLSPHERVAEYRVLSRALRDPKLPEAPQRRAYVIARYQA